METEAVFKIIFWVIVWYSIGLLASSIQIGRVRKRNPENFGKKDLYLFEIFFGYAWALGGVISLLNAVTDGKIEKIIFPGSRRHKEMAGV
jgi:hypothetical protein